MIRFLTRWALCMLAGVLAVVPGVYAQTTDESGQSLEPAVDPPANPVNPNVDTVFTPVNPCRVCDTRFGQPDAGGCAKGVVFGGFSKDVTIAGLCGIPVGVSAVSINITAVPAGGFPGDLRVAPNPPGALPLASIVNYQSGDVAANAADVPIGTGVRIFVDGQAANFVVDVMGYFNDVGCQGGTVKALGQCFEVGLRAATSVFTASDTCRGVGGRLGSGLLLRSLRGGNPLTLAANGEWTDSVYVNGVAFQAMTIANDGGFANVSTIAPNPYRCVFNPLP